MLKKSHIVEDKRHDLSGQITTSGVSGQQIDVSLTRRFGRARVEGLPVRSDPWRGQK
jgi:hypothetical protein